MGRDARLARYVDPRGVMVGEYRIEQPVASGGMGVIYLARNPMLGTRAAAKVLREELAVHPEIVERFLEEAALSAKLQHPNIVQVYDFLSLPDGRPCMLMEYLEGETLQRRATRGPMPLARARPILMQVASALAATHARGVLHLDVKAENVLLTARDGRDDHVKLLDFGLAKNTAIAAGVELSSTLAGTPHYVAPEAVRGRPLDARADVYALGVLAYRLLVGRFPHEGRTVEEVLQKQVQTDPDMRALRSPFVELLLRKALDREPETRLPSVAEFARSLAELPDDAPAPTEPPPPSQARKVVEDDEPPAWLHGPVKTNPEIPRLELADPPLDLPSSAPPTPAPRESESEPASPAPRLELVNPLLDPPRRGGPATIAEQMASMPDSLPAVPAPAPVSPAPPARAEAPAPAPVPAPVPRQRTNPLASPTAAARMAVAGTPAVVLERYLELSDRDHYAFLGIPDGAEAEEVRQACTRTEETLANARGRAGAAQFAQFTALLGRLGRARATLADPEARALYDAKNGNYRGVARCLASGLTLARLEKLHADWAARFPARLARAIELLAAAGRTAQAGDRARAAEVLEQALAADPLNPDLHRRWAVAKAQAL